MTTNILKDYQALSVTAADEIIAAVKNKETAVLCLAAGDTPKLAYALLAQKAKRENVGFSRCTFIGLDEWVGIAPENEGTCRYFLYRNLFEPLGIRPSQIHLFDGLAKDLPGECRKMDDVIAAKKGIDLMLVGVGMNGHIGFNEPGTPADSYSHVVDLDSTTQSVGQKYFAQATTLRQGITLGLKHFLESGRAVLMAGGKKKAEVIREALEGPVTPRMPASIIRRHPNGIAILDQEAASGLTV
ncbi:MAG TPA: glucosamine-6-phosphate deaminase [Chryseosolibacter sp.]